MSRENVTNYLHMYHEITKTMTDALAIHKIITDKDSRITELEFLDVNRSFEKFFNIKADRIIGKTADELFCYQYKDYFTGLNIYSRIDFSRQCNDQEIYCEKVNRWYLIKQINFDDEYLVLIFRNITKEKLLDDNLAEESSKYLKILDQFPNLIWRSGTDAKCNFFNKCWLEFTGRSMDQEMGDGWVQGVHPDDLHRCFNTYMEAFKDQKPFEMEYRLMHHSGEYRWILDCGSPNYEEDGTFAGYIGSCYDIHDEKRLKGDLSNLNQEYETIFNTTQDPMILIDVDPQGNFSYCRASKAHEKYTGIKCDMIKGHSPQEVFGEKTGSELEVGYRRCLDQKSTITFEETLAFDAVERIWHTVLSPIIHDGQVIQIVGVRRDITDSKRMEKELREREELYRSFFENNHAVMMLIEPVTGQIISVNPAACNFYGYTAETLLKMRISEINMYTREQVEKEMEAAVNEKRRQFFFRHKLADGEIRDVEVYSGPILINGKKLLYSIIHDISERRQAERALHNEKELFKVTIHSIGDGLLTTDKEGRITLLNRVAEEITGWTTEEAAGKPSNEVFSIIDSRGICCDDPVRKVLKTVSIIELEENTMLISKNGIKKYIADSCAPIIDSNGNTHGAVLVFRDVTAKKQVEKELEEKNKELSELVKKLKSTQMQMIQQEKMAGIGQLAAGVAHEINNPLGYIISNLNVLMKYSERYREIISACIQAKESFKSGDLANAKSQAVLIEQLEKNFKLDFMNEDMVELLTDSMEGLERINKIVKGLRVFSRAGQNDEYERFDLNYTIENTLLVAANETKYYTSIEKNLGDIPQLYGIPSQINQVLLNLILNACYAIKANKNQRKGKITINTYQEENQITCEIIDNGRGIPESIIDQIFNPFFTTKPVGEGTGLGLSISYDIIKNKHNGCIEVESKEGIGTKFSLKFPIKD